jgi:hypothetical protein
LFVKVLATIGNPPPLYALPENRVTRLEPGKQYIHQLAVTNPKENNSAIYYLIQVHCNGARNHVRSDSRGGIGDADERDS